MFEKKSIFDVASESTFCIVSLLKSSNFNLPSFASIFTETEIDSEVPQKEEGNSSNPDYLVNLTPPCETASILTETEINCDMRQNEENLSNHDGEQVVSLTPSYTASILPETESIYDMRQNEENSSNHTNELALMI